MTEEKKKIKVYMSILITAQIEIEQLQQVHDETSLWIQPVGVQVVGNCHRSDEQGTEKNLQTSMMIAVTREAMVRLMTGSTGELEVHPIKPPEDDNGQNNLN